MTFNSYHIKKFSCNVNIRVKIIKLLEANIGENLCDIILGKDSLGNKKTQTITEKLADWIFKLKTLAVQRHLRN